MLLWTIAIVLLAGWVTAGYYQGAVRAGFTLLGLILGTVLSLPLSGAAQGILSLFGMTHPVLLDLFGPVLILLVVFAVFLGASFFVHSKVYTHVKYRGDEQQRVLWERMNQQVGLCLGVANGVVSVFLVSIAFYVPGYFTVQLEKPDKDPWWLKTINTVAKNVDETGFYKALSPVVPVSEFYYEASDVLGFIANNARLKDRLSRYPLFLPLAEESRFQEMGADEAFQDFWKGGPSLKEFIDQARSGALVKDISFYRSTADLLRDHLDDLKTYLEKGVSPEFADQPLVDRWHFDFYASYQESKRIKPNMTVAERQWVRAVYATVWTNATLTAFLDESVIVKKKSSSGSGREKEVTGKWAHAYGNKYLIRLREDGKWNEFDALVDTNRLTMALEKMSVVFRR